MAKHRIAIVCFFVFLLANTLKVALFDTILSFGALSISQSLFHSGIIIKFLAVCLAFILALRFSRPCLFIALYCLQALYMFVNLSYHAAFEGFLHITQYAGLLTEALDLLRHCAAPSNASWRFIALDVPLFVALIAFYPPIASVNRRFVFKKAMAAFMVLFIFFLFKWQSVEAAQRPSAILNDKYACDNSLVHKYGLLVFNAVDLLHLRDSQFRISRLDYGKEINGNGADSSRPGVIMIQVESMDANIVNTRHGNTWVTPYLHRLSKECVFYPYVLSFHKAGSTSDCEFSVINSVEPFDDYPALKLRNYDYPNSMLRPFLAAKYEAAAFHGNRGSYFNRNVALKKMGFASFYDIAAMGLTEKGWGASDGDVFNFVLQSLQRQSNPFFYYIITMSSHEPFTSVASYYHNDAFKNIGQTMVRDYFQSMSYVDGQLERFIKQVQTLRPNTIFLIYGDHTPPIEANAEYSRASFVENDHLFEFVPLFIITPQQTVYNERLQIALFWDFAPTVLQTTNIDFSIRSHGKNLLAFSHELSPFPFEGRKLLRRDLFQRISTID